MKAAMRYSEEGSVATAYGKVTDRQDEIYQVQYALRSLSARRAAGCLLEPEIGDLVLLSVDDFGRSYILSVLEKVREGVSAISLQGQVEIKTDGPAICLHAGQVSVIGDQQVDLLAPEFKLQTMRGSIRFLELAFLGRLFHGRVEKAKFAAMSVTSMVGRLTEKIRNYYRQVEGLEQLQVGRLRYRANDSLLIKGRRATLLADEKMKIDGEKIDLG